MVTDNAVLPLPFPMALAEVEGPVEAAWIVPPVILMGPQLTLSLAPMPAEL